MTDFWFNHFNVFAGKGATQLYLTEYERDAIRPHVFGKFRDLLGATAKSPAMLFYLDNWQSAAPDAKRHAAPGRTTPGARPVRPAGTHAADRQTSPCRRSGTSRAEAPAARPERELRARADGAAHARRRRRLHAEGRAGRRARLHGLDHRGPRQGGGFRFEPRIHDDGEKIVLGHRIKAGGGQTDGEQVLDILATHPSTARFISTKLARRFVADTPPPALVDRAAARFRETDGDIREVVRTIVTSPEFFSAEAYRAKVKTPFEFVVSAVRATARRSSDAQVLAQAVRSSACRSTCASRRPATPTRRRPGSTPARCSTA